MSKHESRQESRRAFRGDSQGDKSFPGNSDHAEAGDRLRAAAFTPLQRTTHEQPTAPADNSANKNGGERSIQVVNIATARPAAGDGSRTAVGAKDVSRQSDKQTGSDSIPQRPMLDPRQSVAHYVEKGAFKSAVIPGSPIRPESTEIVIHSDIRPVVTDRVREVEQRNQPIEKVKVVYADQSSDPTRRVNKPDFIVKKDGTVQVVSDPEKNNGREVVVQLERDQGQITGPTEVQRKSTDDLVGYLSDRLMRPNADGTKNGVIEDQQGLVSEGLKARLRTQPVPEARLPQPGRHQVESMRRFSGGGHGTMSPEQADSYFTPRDQAPARRLDEPKQQYSVKEAVAGMLSYGEAQPYEAVRNTGDRGLAVGRYQLTYDLVMQWLTDLMGDPPDEAKLDEAVRKGKISPRMAARLRSPQFRQFLEKLKTSQLPSSTEIKENLPKELQEQIGGDLVNKFSSHCRDRQGQVEAGKVALAMATGRVPSEADLSKPENQAYVDAGRRLADISDARTENPGQPLEWQEVNQRLLIVAKQSVGRAMWNSSRYNLATLEYGNLGCAASVSEVMRAAGIDGKMGTAGSILLEEKIIKAGGYRVTDPQPGDIVFGRRPPGGHSKGHVGIVGEDGKVYHNSSGKRYWVEADLTTVFNRKRGFIDIHYVRLPQNA